MVEDFVPRSRSSTAAGEKKEEQEEKAKGPAKKTKL